MPKQSLRNSQVIVFSFFFDYLQEEFKLFVLLPFSAEKLVRQNSFPQLNRVHWLQDYLVLQSIYLVFKETNQNLEKL